MRLSLFWAFTRLLSILLNMHLILWYLHQSKFKNTVDKFTDDIQVLINELRNQSVVLFQLSQQLMKELKGRLLDKSK